MKTVKLLGINIDSELNFDYHVGQLSNKASKILHAPFRNVMRSMVIINLIIFLKNFVLKK